MKNLKLVVSFILGGALGSLVTKNILETRHAAELEYELSEYKNYMDEYKKHLEDTYMVEDAKRCEALKEDLGIVTTETEDELPKPRQPKGKKDKVDYTTFSKPDLGAMAEKYKQEIVSTEASVPGGPYAITQEEFNNENLNWAKISLTFYSGDGVVADEREEVVMDCTHILGQSAEGLLEYFDENPEDPDVAYFRNHKMEADYEVIRVLGSYGEEILGIIPEQKMKKKNVRRTKREDDAE